MFEEAQCVYIVSSAINLSANGIPSYVRSLAKYKAVWAIERVAEFYLDKTHLGDVI